MTKKMMLISGVLALVLVVGLNVRHALNDYGVKDGNLHAEVVAQSTGTGGGTGTGLSWDGFTFTWGGNSTAYDGLVVQCQGGSGDCLNGTNCLGASVL